MAGGVCGGGVLMVIGVGWTVILNICQDGQNTLRGSARPDWMQQTEGKRDLEGGSYISGEAVSGALILTPSFSRLQKSSSICTPGYGEAPGKGRSGWGRGSSCIHLNERFRFCGTKKKIVFLVCGRIVFLRIERRRPTQREDFPEENSEGPHVALAGVHFVKDALGGHPLERQASLRRKHGEKKLSVA